MSLRSCDSSSLPLLPADRRCDDAPVGYGSKGSRGPPRRQRSVHFLASLSPGRGHASSQVLHGDYGLPDERGGLGENGGAAK